MTKQTDVRDSTTRPHLYVIALKKAAYVFFIIFYILYLHQTNYESQEAEYKQIFGLNEQKASLNNKATVSVFLGFTLSTSTNGQRIQRIRKLQIVMLLPISDNSYKIIIT